VFGAASNKPPIAVMFDSSSPSFSANSLNSILINPIITQCVYSISKTKYTKGLMTKNF
jgi:hypothetical protein